MIDVNKKTSVARAPLNPRQNMGQVLGDLHGIMGITDNNRFSADDTTSLGSNDPKALRGMSLTRVSQSNDIATDEDLSLSVDDLMVIPVQISLSNTGQDNDFLDADDYQSPLASPSVQGEQSASGDMPDPESDDDTLENAHMMGQQLGEDEEHPQELDIARDIDEAEEYLRTH